MLVSRYDRHSRGVSLDHIAGFDRVRGIIEKGGWSNYLGHTVNLSQMTKDEYDDFTSGHLTSLKGGLYALSGRSVPKPVCVAIERMVGINNIYTMGFSWHGELYGGITILMRGSREARNTEVVETVVSLGAVALQQAYTEEERAELESKFLQSQKMEAVGKLAGGIAHDFNNLLTVISGYADYIQSSLPDDDELKECAREISLSASRAASLTQQLLAFSRKQIIRTTTVRVGKVVAGLRSMITRLVGEHISMRFVLPEQDICVHMDTSHLEQVVINLVTNARDSMPDGREINISVAAENIKPPDRSSSDIEPGSYATLSVSDTGHGMDEATMRQAFDPFYTSKDLGEGTGLGLATVYSIVQQVGGTLCPQSDVGRGTTMKIYLPETECDADDDGPVVTSSVHKTGSETILLVEDERAVRNLMTAQLEKHHYTVLSAASPIEALTLDSDANRPIDLLITDLIMPGMNGRELADSVSRRHKKVKVLYMSGYTEDVIIRHGIQNGNVEFLQKPFDLDAFLRRVRSILDSDRE